MANHLKQLLEHWHPLKDELDWVLATIIETDGSAYRKSGAMMMINSLGQYFGLLSGGCLESDIMRQARRCWLNDESIIVQYDMREEEDLAWQLGIGCGGMVRIILQPVTRNSNYLQLNHVLNSLVEQRPCWYAVNLIEKAPENLFCTDRHQLPATEQAWFIAELTAPRHLALFGGGVDAISVVQIAATLGWRISVVDPRTSYARASEFTGADQIIKQSASQLTGVNWLNGVDAVIIMNHNVAMDAEALALMQQFQPSYVGMLGPTHRTERVLEQAGLTKETLKHTLFNPIGLRLGGELPESIALSMLAEIHAVLEKADARSISGQLNL